jgi:hypothetical protein
MPNDLHLPIAHNSGGHNPVSQFVIAIAFQILQVVICQQA